MARVAFHLRFRPERQQEYDEAHQRVPAEATGVHVVKATAEMPTSIGLRNDDGAIVGFQRRVTLWDLEDQFETLALVETDQPGNRLNEGCVAPDGSFWV